MKEQEIIEKIKKYALLGLEFKSGFTFEEFSNDKKPLRLVPVF